MSEVDNIPKISHNIGSLELLTSQTVHTSQNFPLKVTVHDMAFLFVFKKDPSMPKVGVQWSIEEETNLIISCINFTDPLGAGLIEPQQVGDLFGRELFITFYIWTPNEEEGKRIINYCVYLGNPL